MTHARLPFSGAIRPTRLSRATLLRLQSGAAVFALTAGILLATRLAGWPPREAAPPLITASQVPTKFRPADNYVGDDETPTILSEAEPEAPPRITELVPRKARAVSLRPDGEVTPVSQVAALEQRAGELRRALGAATPSSASAATPASATPIAHTVAAITLPPPPAPAPIIEEKFVADSTLVMSTPAQAPVARAPRVAEAGYFIQLASSPSEEEARKLAVKLQSRLSADIGGRDLAILPANVKDRAVYRVRLADLSREEANTLCARLKGARAACFVAKD